MGCCTGAELLVRGFSAALGQNPGLDPERLVAGQIWVPFPINPKADRYRTPAQQAGLARELLTRIALLPGIEQSAVGSSSDIPLLGNVNKPLPFSLPDEVSTQENDHAAEFGGVSAGYFAVLKTPLKQGRVFTDHDTDSTETVVVVNGLEKEAIIVGVVGDVRHDGLDMAPAPRVYESILQHTSITPAIFLRTRSDVDVKATEEALTQTVHSINPDLPVFNVRTMADLMSASMVRRKS